MHSIAQPFSKRGLRKLRLRAPAAVASSSFSSAAFAGPFVMADTDADDRGFGSNGANQDDR